MRISPLDDNSTYLFNHGTNYHSQELLGAHVTEQEGRLGVRFAVWAPHAQAVSVVGDFNRWSDAVQPLEPYGRSGIWWGFVPGIGSGTVYKYAIRTAQGDVVLKADPYGRYSELRPNTGSIVWGRQKYDWQDGKWELEKRQGKVHQQPVLVYEVHLGSWRRGQDGTLLSYTDLAEQLVEYVVKMGYTHVELLPVVEHPLDQSWGYQATGYFSVTSRFGTPEEFKYLVDRCHQRGIGVILDWAPGHFCKDDQGLRLFDGTPLYEHPDPLRGENREWGTCNFDYGRTEVLSFLISNALFWLEEYHIDGLRVDAVAYILHLDFNRKPGEWRPNRYGGNGNLEGIAFLRRLNEVVFEKHPGALMIAEESTAWPLVSRPTYLGGLGFNFKWNMGWMNDMLKYMAIDPIHRKWNHNLVTFSFMYAFSENFVLPLSHDEVVHGKRSLIDKMPGDYWQKFANLRAFYGFWMAHPGKKLLFMGGEFGQFIEWKFDDSLDWHLLDYPMHKRLHDYVAELNHLYRREAALWEVDSNWEGFDWIDCGDFNQSVVCFLRRAKDPADVLIVVCNFTPVVRNNYRIGVPWEMDYQEIFNSDAEWYGGSGVVNQQALQAWPDPWHSQPCSLELTLPPLATVFLRPAGTPPIMRQADDGVEGKLDKEDQACTKSDV